MNFNRLICTAFSFILITVFISGCKRTPAPNPTPQITDEVYVTVTPEATEPLETPWRVPTYPPSPTAKPTVTPTATPTAIPVTPYFGIGIRQSIDDYYNFRFCVCDENGLTKQRSEFSSESAFNRYAFDYSKGVVKDAVSAISSSDSLFISSKGGWSDSANGWNSARGNHFNVIMKNDASFSEVLKIIKKYELRENSNYHYTEEPNNQTSEITFYFEVNPDDPEYIFPQQRLSGTDEESTNFTPTVRRGIILTGTQIIYRYGNGTSDTLCAPLNSFDRTVIEKFLFDVNSAINSKLRAIAESNLSNPLIELN